MRLLIVALAANIACSSKTAAAPPTADAIVDVVEDVTVDSARSDSAMEASSDTAVIATETMAADSNDADAEEADVVDVGDTAKPSVCDRRLAPCPEGCGLSTAKRIDTTNNCYRTFDGFCYGDPVAGTAIPCAFAFVCIVSPSGTIFEVGCAGFMPTGFRPCTSEESALRDTAMKTECASTLKAPCCTLGTPSCDCPITDTQWDGTCGFVCDSVPDGWYKKIDDRGCPFWRTSFKSCLGP
jgi:hypothetical protein